MSSPYAPLVSGNLPFNALCKILEKIQTLRRTKAQKHSREECLTKYINGYRDMWPQLERELGITLTAQQKGEDMFQLIRLLAPNLDNVRRSYQMKEKLIGREYIKLTGLSNENKKGQEMLNFKRFDPSGKRFGSRRSFDSLIFEILKNRSNMGSSEFKIQKINEMLDEMTKSRDRFKAQLKVLFNHCSPLEHKWLIRIILRCSLKVPKCTTVILDTLHPVANEMYAVNRDLEDICLTLYDARLAVDKPKICLGKPFGFMLSARANLASIEATMMQSDFFMEIKFDGERVQVHKNQSDFSYFSRGYYEYSGTYGRSLLQESSLSSYLGQAIAPHVLTCILDGEMMSYNSYNKKFVNKGQSHDVKKMRTDDVANQPCYVVFDLLYYNGKLYAEMPLEKRRRVLESFVTPIEGRVHLSIAKRGSTKTDALTFMNEATQNCEEGVVVKKADGFYAPNERDAGWLKLKRDYMDNVLADLDVIIVGAYFAAAKSAKAYDSFMVAVAEDHDSPSKPPTTFYNFGIVHSGISRALLEDILSHTKDAWMPFNREKCPNWLKMSSMTNSPNVIIEPKNSVVITVKAAELIPTKVFMTQCTMRFARITSLRTDKPWTDCMRYSELSKLYRETKGTMAVGELGNDLEARKQATTERKKIPQRKIKCVLGRKIVEVKRTKSVCLHGKEFCVIADELTREDLEKSIKKHGGKCVLLPKPSTTMVVADKLSLRVQDILKSRDVAKTTWLAQCIDEVRFTNPWPADYLGMTEPTKRKLRDTYDSYGDSYDENVNRGKLQHIMEDIHLENSSFKEAWKTGRVLPQLLEEFQRKCRKEKGFGFAGKSFFLTPDVDIMWTLRIAAAGGFIADDCRKADFLLGDISIEGEISGVKKSFDWVAECLDAF